METQCERRKITRLGVLVREKAKSPSECLQSHKLNSPTPFTDISFGILSSLSLKCEMCCRACWKPKDFWISVSSLKVYRFWIKRKFEIISTLLKMLSIKNPIFPDFIPSPLHVIQFHSHGRGEPSFPPRPFTVRFPNEFSSFFVHPKATKACDKSKTPFMTQNPQSSQTTRNVTTRERAHNERISKTPSSKICTRLRTISTNKVFH